MADSSFLHYLSGSKTNFSLRFSTGPTDLNAGNAPRLPFDLIEGAGALTRIMVADVSSDAGSLVKPVFLLLSRDDYHLAGDVGRTLTNLDIESIWRNTFRSHLESGDIIALSAQEDEHAGLVPFMSLFVCTKTMEFFHPLCPGCASELELCRDDVVLGNAGLKPYTKSMKRYLACPACSLKGQKTFYAFEPDASDPVSVKGPAELIMGFAELASVGIPCTRCSENSACFKDKSVLSLVMPVAFYPFYLLMFEAASLNARDFLSLVSGEPFDELDRELAGQRKFARRGFASALRERAAEPMLFAGDDRRFLEILYLKLVFLGEVANHILSPDRRFAYPEFGPSLESLWVRITDQSSLLPAFWNFRLTLIDMDPDIPGVLLSPGGDYAAHCMAMLWFHALLRNRAQDIRAVNEGISGLMKGKLPDIFDPLFMPDNIFWDPRGAPVRYRGLWEKALGLGCDLLMKPGFPQGDFFSALKSLRDEIRGQLFLEAPLARTLSEAPGETSDDDARIGIILKGIKAKWSRAEPAPAAPPTHEAPSAPPPDQAQAGTEDVQATMIIPPAKPPVREEAGEDLSGTMVKAPEKTPAAADADDFSTETIIMRHEDAPAGPPAAEEPEDLDKTMVVSPGPRKAAPKPKDEPLKKPGRDDLEETIIMGAPAKASPPPTQKKQTARHDEDLEETVIIKPEKKK
ncbi:MAG TPA: hypothetical protein VMU10_07655 [Desulfomonilia bacterium]|nr:hypothetical protein [Desulfomonilia bacterium]